MLWFSEGPSPILPPRSDLHDPLHALPDSQFRLALSADRTTPPKSFLSYHTEHSAAHSLDIHNVSTISSNAAHPFVTTFFGIGLPESQVTNSSRLMLDGSSVPPIPQFVIDSSFDTSGGGASEQVELGPGPLSFAKGKDNTASIITFESLKMCLSNRRSSSVQHVRPVLRLSFPGFL